MDTITFYPADGADTLTAPRAHREGRRARGARSQTRALARVCEQQLRRASERDDDDAARRSEARVVRMIAASALAFTDRPAGWVSPVSIY